MKALELWSPAFRNGDVMPVAYTCDGGDISPPLRWDHVPEGTASLALLLETPDDPQEERVHWIVFNLPPHERALPEDLPADPVLPNGARHGLNAFGRLGYSGPCPEAGCEQRFFFKLYALDIQVDLPPGIQKPQLMAAMQGHLLQLAGMFVFYKG